MEEIVITDETHDFFVKFFMEGIEKPFLYKVDMNTYERIRRNFDDDADTTHVNFDASDNVSVVTSKQYTCMVQFSCGKKAAREEKLRIGEASIYYAGRDKADSIRLDDPNIAYGLFDAFETYDDNTPYRPVVDADGKETVIDCRKVVCMEIPQDLVKEGYKRFADELKEENL
jgi:hypothetical protein